jgi:hypothetical protein
MQYGMPAMNPLMRLGLRHPKEVTLHFLDGMLLQVGQDAE